ncbi:hypothetical protein [Hymenobacter lapidiphilus]|uniref:Uncharacterized protein n=1 Tax=Hymenobacter lapidiphilus TaxID=2608003 RepID=A0A7Y7U7E6_9BACT|nr:hypothetical protein [Hymenobacter lapidiphilus]NVO33478.1 hypothetical protein [Hymenobacter lapidiphilus]
MLAPHRPALLPRHYLTTGGCLVRVYLPRCYPVAGTRARLRWQRHWPQVAARLWRRVWDSLND